mmetsp:Transcript_12385/g.34750  ORF Transcript_12385/g.34750 Transcript_12385/m.34750 type:complete len:330 (-) Transcript_12385:18-1007(-)
MPAIQKKERAPKVPGCRQLSEYSADPQCLSQVHQYISSLIKILNGLVPGRLRGRHVQLGLRVLSTHVRDHRPLHHRVSIVNMVGYRYPPGQQLVQGIRGDVRVLHVKKHEDTESNLHGDVQRPKQRKDYGHPWPYAIVPDECSGIPYGLLRLVHATGVEASWPDGGGVPGADGLGGHVRRGLGASREDIAKAAVAAWDDARVALRRGGRRGARLGGLLCRVQRWLPLRQLALQEVQLLPQIPRQLQELPAQPLASPALLPEQLLQPQALVARDLHVPTSDVQRRHSPPGRRAGVVVRAAAAAAPEGLSEAHAPAIQGASLPRAPGCQTA